MSNIPKLAIDATDAVWGLLEASKETLLCLQQWRRELEGKLEYAYIVAQLTEAISKMERMELQR